MATTGCLSRGGDFHLETCFLQAIERIDKLSVFDALCSEYDSFFHSGLPLIQSPSQVGVNKPGLLVLFAKLVQFIDFSIGIQILPVSCAEKPSIGVGNQLAERLLFKFAFIERRQVVEHLFIQDHKTAVDPAFHTGEDGHS